VIAARQQTPTIADVNMYQPMTTTWLRYDKCCSPA
jgi:hypothetical protein